MNQLWLVVVVPVALSLLVNEMCNISPWAAQKLVRRAAGWWALGDADRAAEMAAEWAAVVEDAPGKLTKLGVALRFAAGAQWEFQRYRAARYFMAVRLRAGRAKNRNVPEDGIIGHGRLPSDHPLLAKVGPGKDYSIIIDDIVRPKTIHGTATIPGPVQGRGLHGHTYRDGDGKLQLSTPARSPRPGRPRLAQDARD